MAIYRSDSNQHAVFQPIHNGLEITHKATGQKFKVQKVDNELKYTSITKTSEGLVEGTLTRDIYIQIANNLGIAELPSGMNERMVRLIFPHDDPTPIMRAYQKHYASINSGGRPLLPSAPATPSHGNHPDTLQLGPAQTLTIQTDGICAIITTPAEEKPLAMYCGKEPVTGKPPALKGKAEARPVGSGDEAADNLRNNKKLQAALPPEKLAEIVRLNAGGTPVIVEPYSGPTGPTLTFRHGQSGQAQTQTPSAPPRR